jgi:hypothetical protein
MTLVYTAKNERRRAKLALFQQLVGSRNVLLPGPHDPNGAVLFISAVNQIFLLFHDAPAVLAALKSFHEMISDPNASPDLRNQRLLELFKSMAQHLRINTEPLGEGFFMRAFSVNSVISPQPLNLGVNGIRLQDGKPALFGFQDVGPGQRMPFFMPIDLSLFIGATLMELALVARERDAELRTAGIIDLGAVPDLPQRIERRARSAP